MAGPRSPSNGSTRSAWPNWRPSRRRRTRSAPGGRLPRPERAGSGGAHLGDWYAEPRSGTGRDHLRVRGLKITLDNEWGTIFQWEPADLTETIGRANAAGWQVSVHTVSTEAHDMVLDAFEAAIGATGPNPLHHRIDHAIQVTDEQLARMVAMDLADRRFTSTGPPPIGWSRPTIWATSAPREPWRGGRLADSLARLRRRRAARRGGIRRAVDIPGASH